MGFSGARALILAVVFVVLLVGITKWGFPTWSLAVGIVLAGVILRGAENKASGGKP